MYRNEPTTHPDNQPASGLICIGRSVADVLGALRQTTARGWTVLPAAGAWTPDGSTIRERREDLASTVVLLTVPRRALLTTYAETLRGLLGEKAVHTVVLPS